LLRKETRHLAGFFLKRVYCRMSLKFFLRNEGAATAIEYTLIGAAVGVAIMTAVFFAGDQVGALFDQIAGALGAI
jgi:Flp pilus assembly pilin Flp